MTAIDGGVPVVLATLNEPAAGVIATIFVVELYDASSYETVIADVTRTSTSVVTVAFTTAPTTNDIRVLIRKI